MYDIPNYHIPCSSPKFKAKELHIEISSRNNCTGIRLDFTLGAICHGTLKKSHKILYVPSPYSNPVLLGDRRTLYHVAIKAGLYRKAVQVYDIPNYHIPCDTNTDLCKISAWASTLLVAFNPSKTGSYLNKPSHAPIFMRNHLHLHLQIKCMTKIGIVAL